MIEKIGPKQTMQMLGISRNTLHKYVACGLLSVAGKTPGGKRLFSLQEVAWLSTQDLSLTGGGLTIKSKAS